MRPVAWAQPWAHRGGVALILAAAATVPCVARQVTPTASPGAESNACLPPAAQQSIASGRFKDAEQLLRRTIAVSTCPDAHFLLAYALLRRDLPKESLAEYTAAARLRRPTPTDLRNVALDYVLLGDFADAEHWVLRALETNAADAESWYVLGRVRYSTGKYAAAVEAFEHALSIDPKSLKAENNLGLAFEGLNRTDEAIDAYRKAIALGEESAKPSEQPMINLAIVLEHRSDFSGAQTLLRDAVALAPQDARAREHLGHIDLELNHLPEAQEQLESAVALLPNDARLHFLLGQVYRRQGSGEKAKAEFARSAALNGARSTPEYVK